MSKQRYTSVELREMANRFGHLASNPDCLSVRRPKDQIGDKWEYDAEAESTVQEMLIQAADAKEELAELKTTSDELERRALDYADHGVSSPLLTNTIKRLIAERNSLRSRLEAVVKECEKQIPACRGADCKCNPTGYCDEYCHDEIIVHTAVTAILRVARGEGGAE